MTDKNLSPHNQSKDRMNDLAFILRGKNRRLIFQEFSICPRTISAISTLTGIYLSNVSRVVKDFETRGIIESITPAECRGRLYQLTDHGQSLLPDIELYIQLKTSTDL